MNLAHFLARSARAFPGRPAVASGERALADYGALGRRCAAMASALRSTLRLEPGDRVGLLMTNSPEYVEILWAAWWAGLAVVPVNAKLHPKEAEYILEHSGTRVCFVTPDLARLGLRVRADHRAGSEEYRRLHARDDQPAIAKRARRPGVAVLHERHHRAPKGVMITHRNLLAMTLCYFADVDRIGADDCIIHAAPMSHGSGLYGLPHVLRGAKQVIPRAAASTPPRSSSCALMPASRCSPRRRWSSAWSITRARRIRRSTASRRSFTAAGRCISPTSKNALAVMGQRFVQIYGQGGGPMTITALGRHHFADSAIRGTSSVWRRWASRSPGSRSASPTRTTGRCRLKRPGEVLVRGDAVMKGYWRNPEATAPSAARRVAAHRRRRRARRGRLSHPDGPLEGPDHQRWLEHLPAGGRGDAAASPGRPRGLGRRPPAPGMGRGGGGVRRGARRERRRGSARSGLPRPDRAVQAADASTGSSTACRRTTTGKVLKTDLRAQLAREREAGG